MHHASQTLLHEILEFFCEIEDLSFRVRRVGDAAGINSKGPDDHEHDDDHSTVLNGTNRRQQMTTSSSVGSPELSKGRTLSDYNIQEGSTPLLRLRGGLLDGYGGEGNGSGNGDDTTGGREEGKVGGGINPTRTQQVDSYLNTILLLPFLIQTYPHVVGDSPGKPHRLSTDTPLHRIAEEHPKVKEK
ncbi:hypothetical protein ONZ45_g19510 [Pleurotus djamor]|nr:hypothetical protein ONZ45_g19510 [Pleurotus djamor]